MISSVIKNSLLKTSFKFMSFQRNLVSTKMNSRSYIFSLKISTSIKAIKQQKEFQIEIKVDPEIPFDIKFDNIIVKDSLEPPSESHITQHFKGNFFFFTKLKKKKINFFEVFLQTFQINHFELVNLPQQYLTFLRVTFYLLCCLFSIKVLKENKFETWVLQLIELFLQDTLEGIHERTQMMYTDDTQYYKHEIQKQMNIDDSDLKKTPELDNVVKEKYFPQISILTLPQSRPIPQYANMRNQNQMRNYQMMAGQNQIQHSRSPNPSNQRNQSGNPYENIPQQQQQNRPYLPHQMINNNQIDANQLRQQQINPQIRQMQRPQFYQQHMLLNPTLNPPVVNQQIPRQNSQQPHPQNQPLMPPVQDIRIRQTSQSGSINQIPPQQNSNPNLVVAPRPPHQQAPQPDAMIQPHGAQIPLQSGIPPHIQKKELQQNHNIAHSQVQQPSLIQQNSNQNHPNIQPHMQNPQYNQYISGNLQQQQQLPGVPPSGQIQQQQMNQHQTQNIPLQQPNMQVGGIQPQINNPAQNVQQQPAQFDPNLGPNNFQQHQPPPGIMARSNHPIAPQNY